MSNHTNHTSVTLYANDSINLTTGQVTRSTTQQTTTLTTRERILKDSARRAHRNDLNALAYIIRNTQNGF